jgi:hypothetical protein
MRRWRCGTRVEFFFETEQKEEHEKIVYTGEKQSWLFRQSNFLAYLLKKRRLKNELLRQDKAEHLKQNIRKKVRMFVELCARLCWCARQNRVKEPTKSTSCIYEEILEFLLNLSFAPLRAVLLTSLVLKFSFSERNFFIFHEILLLLHFCCFVRLGRNFFLHLPISDGIYESDVSGIEGKRNCYKLIIVRRDDSIYIN